MPSFNNSLIAISRLCDENCTVLFTKHTVNVFDPEGKTILTGWRDQSGPCLWRFSLLPTDDIPPIPHNIQSDNVMAFSAYNLPIIEARVRFYHAAAGIPVKFTWLQATNARNFTTWNGLTTTNATKYCPDSVETSKGHTTQTRQGLCSTNPERGNNLVLVTALDPSINEPFPPVASNEVHVKVAHIRKL